jgi:hypothetical protein
MAVLSSLASNEKPCAGRPWPPRFPVLTHSFPRSLRWRRCRRPETMKTLYTSVAAPFPGFEAALSEESNVCCLAEPNLTAPQESNACHIVEPRHCSGVQDREITPGDPSFERGTG